MFKSVNNKTMKKIKKLNIIILMIMSGINIFFIIKNITNNELDRLIDNGTLFAFLLIPFIIRKTIKKDLNELFKLLYYIYIILMIFFGEVLELTKHTLWFDKIAHLFFGFLVGVIALIFLKHNKNPKENIFFNMVFIIGLIFIFSIFWEFIEYFLDRIFNSNHQRYKNTDMNDTMIDLLVSFLGGIILNIKYFIEIKTNRNGLVFYSIMEEK